MPGNSSEPTTPRPNEPLLVNRSNSCVYSSSSETQNGNKRSHSDELCGWEVCKRPHSAVCIGHPERQKPNVLEELRELNRRPGKPSCCSAFPNRFGSLRQKSARASNPCSPDLLKYRKTTRDRVDESSSVGNFPGSIQKSPIKVGKHFKHFRRNNSYIDQYREEYTYKKLRDLNRPASVDSLVCRCGSPNCSSSRSTPCLSTWHPLQSQLVRPMSLPRDMSSMASVTSPVPHMKTPTIPHVKKRLQMATYVKQLAKSIAKQNHDTKKFDKPSTALVQEATKMEFFSNSLTVNNYNPTSTAKQSHSAARLGGTGHVRQLGTSCRTRGRDFMGSPNVTAYERFYQNKNERGQ